LLETYTGILEIGRKKEKNSKQRNTDENGRTERGRITLKK
jgi:hypothetical protein